MSLGKLEKETEQDINYDNITMEMSEDSSHNEDSSNRSNSVESHSSSESHNSSGKKSSKKIEYSHRSEERRRHSVSPEDQRNRDDRKRKYGKDGQHRDRDREDRRSYKRSRSPSYHRYERSRRSHSRSPRDRGRHSRRDHHSPERRRRDHHDRSRGTADRKPSRLSVLDKLGIELKLPDKDKDGSRLSLPSYYNPMVVNPAKYAEQIAKRKLLWGNSQKQKSGPEEKPEAPEAKPSGQNIQNIWQGARFSQDQDGKLTAKFQRLMGIKNVANGPEQPSSSSQVKPEKDLLKKQEEMFSSMELQYEVARQATHTQRGVGLGFGAHHFPPK